MSSICYYCNLFVSEGHMCPPRTLPEIELDAPFLTAKAIPSRTGLQQDATVYGGE